MGHREGIYKLKGSPCHRSEHVPRTKREPVTKIRMVLVLHQCGGAVLSSWYQQGGSYTRSRAKGTWGQTHRVPQLPRCSTHDALHMANAL